MSLTTIRNQAPVVGKKGVWTRAQFGRLIVRVWKVWIGETSAVAVERDWSERAVDASHSVSRVREHMEIPVWDANAELLDNCAQDVELLHMSTAKAERTHETHRQLAVRWVDVSEGDLNFKKYQFRFVGSRVSSEV